MGGARTRGTGARGGGGRGGRGGARGRGGEGDAGGARGTREARAGGGRGRRAGGLGEEAVVAADGLDEADGDHVGEDGGAAVGDEGEREAGDRHDADGHADVDERLEDEPDRHPGRHQHAEHVVGELGGADRAEHDDAEQGDDDGGADEAEFLARDGEDEVGLDRGDEVAAGERAVEQALAVQAAGADRDLGLEAVVAGAGQVLGGVQERRSAGSAGTP